MARIGTQLNEDQSGLTLVCRVKDVMGVQYGGDFAMTEVGTDAYYYSDELTGIPAGEYGLFIFNGGNVVAQHTAEWDGEMEMSTMNMMESGKMWCKLRRR